MIFGLFGHLVELVECLVAVVFNLNFHGLDVFGVCGDNHVKPVEPLISALYSLAGLLELFFNGFILSCFFIFILDKLTHFYEISSYSEIHVSQV